MKKNNFTLIAILIVFVGFIFNGCSANNEVIKQEIPKDSRCSLKPETGPCKALFKKFYFDKISATCKEFVWGGCEGIVPFETLEECRGMCEN